LQQDKEAQLKEKDVTIKSLEIKIELSRKEQDNTIKELNQTIDNLRNDIAQNHIAKKAAGAKNFRLYQQLIVARNELERLHAVVDKLCGFDQGTSKRKAEEGEEEGPDAKQFKGDDIKTAERMIEQLT
jgi:uncharacterized coiled-coil protein SlyX